MQRAFLYENEIKKEIASLSELRPSSSRSSRSVTASLVLTSLVDVFSILVIYLLVATSNQPNDLNIDGIELPTSQISSVIDSGRVVKINDDGVFINESLVPENQIDLAFETILSSLKSEGIEENQWAIVIQADKDLDYERVDPIVLKATAAGFSKLRFAVVTEGR